MTEPSGPEPTVPEQVYHAYGRRIASALPLPELRTAPPGDPVHWRFEVVASLPEPQDPVLLGRETIYADVAASLLRHRHGHRISVPDTGTFDLAPEEAGTTTIRWVPNPEPWWDFGRGHLLGRVLAMALHLEGILTLHGSAVEMADGVVGFLAPKHFGKSTLSLRLYRAGARFVTDDALPVLPTDPPTVLPGIQSLRVRAGDREVPVLAGGGTAMTPGEPTGGPAGGPLRGIRGRDGKIALPPLPPGRILEKAAPLAALYLLDPVEAGHGMPAATRTRLPTLPGALGLVGQAKIGAMLGPTAASSLLEAASRIVGSVPVHRLSVVRDLERLPEVVETLVAWHGLPGPEPGPGQQAGSEPGFVREPDLLKEDG